MTKVRASILVGLSVLAGLKSAVGMTIVINPDVTLAGNALALAAFDRAGQAWSSQFSNNITINISAGFSGSFSNPGLIGNTQAVKFAMGYDQFRGYLLASAAKDPNDAIVASTPDNAHFTATLPAGFGLNTLQNQTQRVFLTTKANYKALDLPIDLDATYRANDATITFNTAFKFDYDNSNGVDADKIDFQSVATHELGHALGFLSAVDTVDNLKHNGITSSALDLSPLDLFRFADNVAGSDPSTSDEFTNDPRDLNTGGSAIFDDLTLERALSTGRYTGDGLEASHWKDDALTGHYLGIMDPSMNLGQIESITANDVRALDVIGYDVVPEPATLSIMAMLLPLLAGPARRRSKSCQSARQIRVYLWQATEEIGRRIFGRLKYDLFVGGSYLRLSSFALRCCAAFRTPIRRRAKIVGADGVRV